MVINPKLAREMQRVRDKMRKFVGTYKRYILDSKSSR